MKVYKSFWGNIRVEYKDTFVCFFLLHLEEGCNHELVLNPKIPDICVVGVDEI